VQQEAEAPDDPKTAKHDHRDVLAPGVHALHASFAPVWHEDPGPTRSKLACAEAPKWTEMANGNLRTPPLEVDADAWNAAREGMVSAVHEIGCLCATKSSVEEPLTKAHDALHQFMELTAAH